MYIIIDLCVTDIKLNKNKIKVLMPCLSSLCTDLLIIQFQISNHLFS